MTWGHWEPLVGATILSPQGAAPSPVLNSCLLFIVSLVSLHRPPQAIIFSATHLTPTPSTFLSPFWVVSLSRLAEVDDGACLNHICKGNDEA